MVQSSLIYLRWEYWHAVSCTNDDDLQMKDITEKFALYSQECIIVDKKACIRAKLMTKVRFVLSSMYQYVFQRNDVLINIVTEKS